MVNAINYWYQKWLAENKKVTELEEQVKTAEDHAYFAGSEAMRVKLIDKACEWLNNFYNEDRDCFLVKEDIDAFKQAMEE